MIDLSQLNDQQREAVLYVGGPLLVSAGAGSGKTRVITYRIAHLMYDLGIDPSSILAVTFTNKAANEMRERALRLLQSVDRRLTVSTFHTFCARFLRRHAGAAGLQPSFTIADVSEQERIFKRAVERNRLQIIGTAHRSLTAISRMKESGRLPEQAVAEAGSYEERTVAALYQAYQAALREQNALDFDDLLLYSVHVLKSSLDVLAHWRGAFSHVLIDEYQDTNFLQFELVRLLADEQGRGLCVVGDEDQSIYGWRGASIDHIRRFESDFRGAKVILLEQNYRSTGQILAGASRLIGWNRNRYAKILRTTGPGGEPIVAHVAEDHAGQVDFVLSQLARLIQEGETPAAILYRANHHSRAFEDGLVHAGLKYKIVGSLRFYERKEIKDITSYLRLLANPRDVQAFMRAANVPPRKGLGPKSLETVVETARATATDLIAAAEHVAAAGALPVPASNALRELVRVIRQLEGPSPSITTLVESVLRSTDYENSMRRSEAPDEAEERIGNVRELLLAAAEFERQQRGGLLDFIDSISLVTGQDEVDSSAPVILMTIHCAKGLEFPSVFLVNMNEGAFPLPHLSHRPDELEEERRLCYVGMTRAMRRLILTSNADTLPSRFLNEMGVSGMAAPWRSGAIGRDLRPLFGAASSPHRIRATSPGSRRHPFEPSDRVVHDHFGSGTVLRVDGDGDTATATVAFDEHGVKRLVLTFAKLMRA